MKSKYIHHIVLGLLILLFSCKSKDSIVNSQTPETKSKVVTEAIQAYLKTTDSYQIIPNANNSYDLYIEQTKLSEYEPVNIIKFFVHDKLNDRICYHHEFTRAEIKWLNNDQLLLIKKMGIEDKKTGKRSESFIINILTQEIIEYNLSNSNK